MCYFRWRTEWYLWENDPNNTPMVVLFQRVSLWALEWAWLQRTHSTDRWHHHHCWYQQGRMLHTPHQRFLGNGNWPLQDLRREAAVGEGRFHVSEQRERRLARTLLLFLLFLLILHKPSHTLRICKKQWMLNQWVAIIMYPFLWFSHLVFMTPFHTY